MQELLYLFRLGGDEDTQNKIADWLSLPEIPDWIRIATLAPLSNFGFPPGSVGAIVGANAIGVLIGVDGAKLPRILIPWQNIAYLGDGDELYDFQQNQQAQAPAEPVEATS